MNKEAKQQLVQNLKKQIGLSLSEDECKIFVDRVLEAAIKDPEHQAKNVQQALDIPADTIPELKAIFSTLKSCSNE